MIVLNEKSITFEIDSNVMLFNFHFDFKYILIYQ